MKKCPYCGEEIKKEATKCSYCGKFLEDERKEITKKGKIDWLKRKINSSSDFITGTPLNRIGREKYLSRNLIVVAIMFILYAIAMAFESAKMKGIEYFFLFIFGIIGIYCSIFIMKKRLHDIGFSGWWQLLIFIPYVNGIFSLCLLFIPGNEGKNKYGEASKITKRERSLGFIILSLYIIFIILGLLGVFN